jgi:hypothetical protein
MSIGSQRERERERERERKRERERQKRDRKKGMEGGEGKSAFPERQKLETVFWVLKCERNFKRSRKKERKKFVSLSD